MESNNEVLPEPEIDQLEIERVQLVNERNDLLEQFNVFHKQLPKLLKDIANLGVKAARIEERQKYLREKEELKEVTK